MADAISLQLNIENSLKQTLQQTQTVMKSFNSTLEKAGKNFQSMNKSADQLVDHYDDIEVSQKKITKATTDWGKGLKKVSGFVKQIASGFLAIFSTGGLLNLLKQTMSLDDTMKDLSFRMGEAGKTTQQLKDAVYGASQATGIATSEMMGLVKQLKELRVPSNVMQEMATNTGRFSDITGITADNAARLTGELMRTGRLGATATTNILAGMVKVQRVVGMTSGEMQELSEGIIYSTKMLNQMGKSAGQIENFNKGVVKLAAAFTQVGLSAADANKFVEELLDPGRVEENAFLYSKLGVSLEDAFAGNVDPATLASGFKDLGQELKNMSGPAAAAMAQQLGMPLGKLRQMSEMDLSQLEDAFNGGASSADQLANAQNEQLSAQDRLEKSMNRISNTISGLMDKLMPMITKLSKAFEWLVGKGTGAMKSPLVLMILGAVGALGLLFRIVRRRFLSVATDTKKAITTAIVEGMNQGSQHGATMMRQNISGRAVNRQARVMAGPQYEGMQGRAEEFSAMATGNLFGGVKRMTEGTSNWLRTISMGARPMSRLTNLTEQSNQAMLNSLHFARQEAGVMKGIFQTRRSMAEQTKADVTGRIQYLSIIDKELRTSEQQRELNTLMRKNEKANRQIEKANAAERRQNTRLERRERMALNNMTEEALRKIAVQMNEEAQQAKSTRNIAMQRIESLQKEQLLLQENIKSVAGDVKKTRELEQLQSQISSELREQEMIRDQALAQQNKLTNEHRRMAEIAGKRNMRDIFNPNAIAKTQSIWRKTGRFIQSSFGLAAVKVSEAFDKAKDSAILIARNLGEKLRPRNVISSVRQRFSAEGRQAAAEQRQSGGGIGGALGKIAKMLGPIMLIMRLLGRMEPIQKVLSDIMAKVKPFIQKIGEVLAPVIEKIANAVMPALTSILSALMPLFTILGNMLGDIFEKLGPVLTNLVKLLLPPLIWVLGLLLTILGKVVEAVGGLFKAMMELPIRLAAFFRHMRNAQKREEFFNERVQKVRESGAYQVFDAITQVGTAIADAGKELRSGQIEFDDTVGAVPNEIRDGVAEGMSSETTRNWTPAMLRSAEQGIVVERQLQETQTTTIANASAATADSTETVAEQTTATREAVESQGTTQRKMLEQQGRMLAEQQITNSLLRDLAVRMSN